MKHEWVLKVQARAQVFEATSILTHAYRALESTRTLARIPVDTRNVPANNTILYLFDLP
jgi:hypothetical protein